MILRDRSKSQEALAAGLPIACSRAGALPEAGGELVEYFDPEDVPAIAEAISRALAAGPPPSQAVSTWLDRFAPEAIALECARLYRRAYET